MECFGEQDAFNLGWKLALVTRGEAPAWILDTYEQVRGACARACRASRVGLSVEMNAGGCSSRRGAPLGVDCGRPCS